MLITMMPFTYDAKHSYYKYWNRHWNRRHCWSMCERIYVRIFLRHCGSFLWELHRFILVGRLLSLHWWNLLRLQVLPDPLVFAVVNSSGRNKCNTCHMLMGEGTFWLWRLGCMSGFNLGLWGMWWLMPSLSLWVSNNAPIFNHLSLIWKTL
jgi:hypothetical protein